MDKVAITTLAREEHIKYTHHDQLFKELILNEEEEELKEEIKKLDEADKILELRFRMKKREWKGKGEKLLGK